MGKRRINLLRFISVLLLFAMLMTSQTFVAFAMAIEDESILKNCENNDWETENKSLETINIVAETESMEEEITTELVAAETSSTATVASTDEEETLEEIYTVDQPFHFQRNDREQVVLNTGALKYSENLISVPAMGNNKLSLQLNYASDESALIQHDYYLKYKPVYIVFYRKRETIYYASGKVIKYGQWQDFPFYDKTQAEVFWMQKAQYSLSDTVPDISSASGEARRDISYDTDYKTDRVAYSYGNSSKEQTFNERRYDLGAGWSFNIPAIDYGTHLSRLILPGKGSFAFSNNTFKDYPLKDMVLANDSDYKHDQFDSSKKLTYTDGTVYYFDSAGRLLAIVDRFGNTITYNYVQINGEYHLSAIIDTTAEKITGEQHRITIVYAVTDTGKKITITAPDGSITELYTQTLDSTLYGENNSVLEKIVYSDGEIIHFDYTIQDATYSYSSDADQMFKYMLLNKVTYDTGSELHYTYEMQDVDLGNGHLNTYRLTERYTLDTINCNTVIDKIKYSYTGDYSRNKAYKTETIEVGENGNTRTEYTFNKDHLCTGQTFYVEDIKKRGVSTTYDDYDLPKKVTTTIYGLDTLVTAEQYAHDEYGNTTSFYSAKAEGKSTNTEYRTKSEYKEVFWFPRSVTYKQDADTTIVIKNVPTAKKDNIDYTEVTVNGVLVAKTKYTYDAYGRTETVTACLDLSGGTGTVTVYEYSGVFLAAKTVQNVVGNDEVSVDLTVAYTYDKMGRVLTETDGKGNTTISTYDTRGRVASVIHPDGRAISYTYDLSTNRTTAASTDRESIMYNYNPAGLLETLIYKSGDFLTEYFYDENGRLIAEATGRGSTAANTAYYNYDAFDRVLEKVIYDANHQLAYRETYEYNDALNSSTSLITKTVHGNGDTPDLVTKTYTNKYGEVVKEDIGGVITEYAYDYIGNPIRVYRGEVLRASFTYDHNGNVLTETNAAGDTRTVTYDAIGRKVSETDFMGNVTAYTYDNAGRLLTMTAPLSDTTDSVTKFYYDANGNIIKQQQSAQADDSTEPEWRTVEQTYDAMNRVTDIASHVDAETKQYTHYTYNLAGDLTGVYTGLSAPWSSEGDNTALSHIAYAYDERGNNTALTDALEQTESYEYDKLGMLVSATQRDGKVIRYTYNAFGNVVSDAVYANSTAETPLSQKTTVYTLTGAVASATMDGETVAYTYDALGNVLTETEGNVVKAYTYDGFGRRSGYTLTIDGVEKSTASYVYDNLDRLISVTEGGKTTTYTYDANGNRASQTVDGVTTTYTYNKANLVTSMTNSTVDAEGNSIVISAFAYTYYTDGNMRTKTETVADTVSTTTYVYDGMGRLLSETKGEESIAYTYDTNGNRTEMDNDGVITLYTYDANNRLVTEGDTTYTYDNNGNMLSAVTHLSDTHTFVFGVCAVCGDPETYMLGDANLDGKVSLLDIPRILKFVSAESQAAAYGLRSAQISDPADMDENGTVDALDYWLFLEVVIGYTPAAPLSLSDAEPYDAFADVDENGIVDTADYAAVLAEYTGTSNRRSRLAADVNGDGVITQADATDTVYHATNDCACGIGDIVNNTTPCTSTKTYTYNARGQQIGYTESSSTVSAHTFADGVCTLCGETETYMLADADGNGIINFLDFLVATRYYTDLPDELPPKDLDGDGAAGRKDYLIFARELGGIDENYIPNPFIIDDLLAFADVDGNGEVEAADYLLAYATLYEKEIGECLTNGISLKTSMQAADINGDGTVTEADKEIGIDYALSGSSSYPIGETVENTYPCIVAVDTNIVTAQYAYNPSGLRSAKTVGGSTKYFVYNGMNIVFEYDDVSETLYYYGLNRTHNSNGEIYVYNAHGDTVQLVQDNAVTVSYTYDAFGNLTSQVGESDNAFLYCSEYFDEETGTYYLRARYYNPANGRFTQQDAWAFMDASDSLSLNLYTYCSNNPVAYVDPSGYFREPGYVNGVWSENPDADEFGERSDTYRILADLSERWWDADEAERERLHDLAEKTREMFRNNTPYKYGNVLIKELLHTNLEIAMNYQNSYLACREYNMILLHPHTWLTIMHFDCFGGPWDYKWDPNWQVPSHYEDSFFTMDNGKIDDYKHRRNYFSWIYFEGELMGADKLANFNWGYVGTKMGYGGWLLLNGFTVHKNEGAGGDGYWIEKGIALANAGY